MGKKRNGLGQPSRKRVIKRKFVPTFKGFTNRVLELLGGTAGEKGYNSTGADGPNQLNEFAGTHFPGHELGEVVYKCVRFQNTGNPEDLLKGAAWLFLRWRRAMREQKSKG